MFHERQVDQGASEVQADELRRLQLELSSARDRYRELYLQAPVACVSIDSEGRILDANHEASALLGRSLDALRGTAMAELMAAEDEGLFQQHLQLVLSTRKKQSCQLRLQAEDELHALVHIDSVAYPDPAPKTSAAVDGGHVGPSAGTDTPARCCRSVIIDLGALKLAPRVLRSRQSSFLTMLDTAPDAMIGMDADGRIEALNGATERMFGYSLDDMIGQSIRMLLPVDCGPRNVKLDRYLQTGEAERLGGASWPALGRKRDGATIPLEITLSEWHDGETRKLTAIIRDVSERAAAEERLHTSEQRFREIAESIEDVFFVQDTDGQSAYVSPAYEQIWGRPGETLIDTGESWLEAIHPDDRGDIAHARAQLLQGAPFDEEYRILRPDGEERWIRERAFPICDTQQRLCRVVGVAHDVTSERALEEELRQAQKMDAVGALASGIAHDFNNVLQAILGCLNIALDPTTAPGSCRDYLQRAASAARRGGDLTAQLMGFTRRRPHEVKRVQVDRVIKTTARMIDRLLTEQVTLDIVAGAPEATVLGSDVLLEQILLNLAINARDAMPHGGRLIVETSTVALSAEAAQQLGLAPAECYLRLRVQDNGMGMANYVKERIFERFFTTKAPGQGTGLGLTIVLALTRQLGGTVEVDTQLGEGTTFTLYLPCELGDALDTLRIADTASQR